MSFDPTEAEWYVSINGHITGPFSYNKIFRDYQSGRLPNSSLLRAEGTENWHYPDHWIPKKPARISLSALMRKHKIVSGVVGIFAGLTAIHSFLSPEHFPIVPPLQLDFCDYEPPLDDPSHSPQKPARSPRDIARAIERTAAALADNRNQIVYISSLRILGKKCTDGDPFDDSKDVQFGSGSISLSSHDQSYCEADNSCLVQKDSININGYGVAADLDNGTRTGDLTIYFANDTPDGSSRFHRSMCWPGADMEGDGICYSGVAYLDYRAADEGFAPSVTVEPMNLDILGSEKYECSKKLAGRPWWLRFLGCKF